MPTRIRRYNHRADYEKVGWFLVRTHGRTGGHINWVQPRWEYMHYHPLIRGLDLSSIGIWVVNGDIVGVVHPEHCMGLAYFEIHPDHGALKEEMLRYAEDNLSSWNGGRRQLGVVINDQDEGFQQVIADRGYGRNGDCEPMSRFTISDPFPAIPLPAGFRLKSLAEDNDLQKVDRVLWRGFNHGDEPPRESIGDRYFMQSAPNFRKDLNIVVEAPNGDFVSYCGIWHEAVNQFAYVEPVATDPAYRRKGLGRAAVLEGIRRCGAMGARFACVGSARPFFLSLGFQRVYNRSVWRREWRS